VPGRGETPASYGRFGARLAADAYRVRVLPSASTHLAAALTGAVAGIPDLVRPLVLAGADAGAAAVGALLAKPDPDAAWWPDAAVLAALPGYEAHRAGEWDDELDARTHCPTHRGVLTGDPSIQRGALATTVPSTLLDAAYGSTAEQPHLLLVGDADPLASRADLARLAKSLPSVRLSVVRGAHHDVLNDLQHRSVAAEVVAFLEAVRGGSPLTPIVHVESSSW
jgi:pimeloyl-ACP methyl ester carboxylesterase